jgi:hypothetical protein
VDIRSTGDRAGRGSQKPAPEASRGSEGTTLPETARRLSETALLLLKDIRAEKEAIDSFYQPSIHFIIQGINYHDDDSGISIAILLETTISWVFGQRKH